MMEENPYDSSDAPTTTDSAAGPVAGASRIRFWLFLHVAAVAVMVLFSLMDSSGLDVPRWIKRVMYGVAPPVVIACMGALFICPIKVLQHVWRSSASVRLSLSIICVEIVVCVAHVVGVLPLVQ